VAAADEAMRATQLLLASPRLLRKALNATKTLVPMKKGKVLTRIFGERNLLKICMQNKHCQLQVVNTAQRDPPGGHIFLHASTREKVLKLTLPNLSDANAARETAKLLASRAHEMGQTLFTYERGKQRYMGKVKVVLDTLREHGIRFVSRVDSRKSRDYSAADAAPDEAEASAGQAEAPQPSGDELQPLGFYPRVRLPGDWVCPECRALNAFNVYARTYSRMSRRRAPAPACGVSRPCDTSLGGSGRPWLTFPAPSCADARRHICFRCKAPMPTRYAVPPNAVGSVS
jgi:ribosomal protein L18